MTDEIFREVDEDLRAERIRLLARRFAGLGLGIVILGAIAGGAWEYHVSQRDKLAQQQSGLYVQALHDAGNDLAAASPDTPLSDVQKKALATLTVVSKDAPSGLATLARFRVAAADATHGKLPDALALWSGISQDQQVPASLRDIAALYWCQWQVDSGDAADVRSRLSLLTGKDKPLAPLAEELLATLDLRAGHVDDARKRLTALAGNYNAPEGVRMRANTELRTLGNPGGGQPG